MSSDSEKSSSSGLDKNQQQRLNPFKSLQSFLSRGRSVPGTIRISRSETESDDVPSAGGGQADAGQAGVNDSTQDPRDMAESDASASPAPRPPSARGEPNTPARTVPEVAESAGVTPDCKPSVTPGCLEQNSAASSSMRLEDALWRKRRSKYRPSDRTRIEKFKKILSAPQVDLYALRELSWSGIPAPLRPECWRLLLGYQPPNADRKESVIARKRQEYRDCLPRHFEVENSERSEEELNTLRQILVDVPRTAPTVPFFHTTVIQESLTRILYIWAIRHPASGYVQGINDLVTPFLCIFLSEKYDQAIPGGSTSSSASASELLHLRRSASDMTMAGRSGRDLDFNSDGGSGSGGYGGDREGYLAGGSLDGNEFCSGPNGEELDLDSWDVTALAKDDLLDVEADCYWCLSKLLDGIQDHYTFSQPGIQRQVFRLKELVRRVDERVYTHFEHQRLEFLQFAFRWFNCLLLREVPFHLVYRLWDTYLSEGDHFQEFLVYACASFLLTWSEQLRGLEFQDMLLFLQHMPTDKWTSQEMEMVLSQAFIWRTMFDKSPNHLTK
eukprot:jgi/Mesvir1/12985/Mv05995-RA.1